MKSIKFDISNKRELAYIQELLVDKPWFDRKNFPIFWPKQTQEIAKEVNRVKPTIEKAVAIQERKWRAIEKDYIAQVSQFRHAKLATKYICHISYFGPEGRYKCPDTLNIRLRTAADKKRAIETIGHELLHLLFNDYFEKNKCSYREREWLVDNLILKSSLINLFPHYTAQEMGKPKPKLLASILNN